jgi:hypothetical protein
MEISVQEQGKKIGRAREGDDQTQFQLDFFSDSWALTI